MFEMSLGCSLDQGAGGSTKQLLKRCVFIQLLLQDGIDWLGN